MRPLDEQEERIVKELIRNPRISDNQIAKNTRIPVMSVNRKRKRLEQEGILSYYADVNRGINGTGLFLASQIYIIKMKSGITASDYACSLYESDFFKEYNLKYHADSYLAEKDGHLAIVLILEAETEADLVEIFNGEIVKRIKERHGDDCIKEVTTARIHRPLRIHHNYLPEMNMEKGVIKKDWPDEFLFVDRLDLERLKNGKKG